MSPPDGRSDDASRSRARAPALPLFSVAVLSNLVASKVAGAAPIAWMGATLGLALFAASWVLRRRTSSGPASCASADDTDQSGPPSARRLDRYLGKRSCFALLLAIAGIAWVQADAAFCRLEDDTAWIWVTPGFKQARLLGRIVSVPIPKHGYQECLFQVDTGVPLVPPGRRAPLLLRVRQPPPGFKRGATIHTLAKIKPPPRIRNRGGLDARLYCASRGVSGIAYVDGEDILVVDAAHLGLGGLIQRCRDHVSRTISQNHPESFSRLLHGIMLGESGSQAEEFLEQTRSAGVAHIMAVSGLHVGFVVGIVLAITAPFKGRRILRVFVALPLLFLFSQVTGSRPSVVRASWMTAAVLGSGVLYRRSSAINTLALVGLVSLITNPLSLHDVGFQLSYGAVAAILLIAVPCMPKVSGGGLASRLAGRLVSMLVVSTAVQLVLAPLLIMHFRSFSIVAPIANLVVVPLLGCAITLGCAEVLLSWNLPGLGALVSGVAAANDLVLGAMRFSIGLFGRFPLAAPTVPSPPGVLVVVHISLALGLGYWRSKRTGMTLGVAAASLLCLIATAHFMSHTGGVSITFLDVGQGDCCVIQERRGEAVLVDTGGRTRFHDYGSAVLVPFLEHRGVRKIRWITLSHSHSDHAGGLSAVLNRYPDSRVLLPPGFGVDSVVENQAVVSGDTLWLSPDSYLVVLHPPAGVGGECLREENDRSLVLMFHFRDFRALFTGDITSAAEAHILRHTAVGPCSVVKVPHHGSKASSSKAFTQTCSALVSVISVGSNNFGHPAKDVLDRWAESGAVVVRTDLEGALCIWTDGSRLSVRTVAGRWRRWRVTRSYICVSAVTPALSPPH